MSTGTDDIEWMIAREIPRLRRYALALVRDSDRADDLVQDCLERAIRKQRQWTGEGSLRSWLYRITYTIFINQLPRQKRSDGELHLDDAPEGGETMSEPATQEQRMALHDIAEALQGLPGDQRAAIVLTAVEGLSYDEASAVLGIRIGTLRSRLARGRDTLRSLFRPGNATETSSSPVTLRRVK